MPKLNSHAMPRARVNHPQLQLTLAFVSLLTLAACSDSVAPKATSRTIEGASRNIGQGTARAWVTLDANDVPTSLGVSITEAAMLGLPSTPIAPPNPSALMLSLPLPTEAKGTGFDHVSLDWNPNGHDPLQIYGLPHFDFHFYTVSDSAQMSILPSDPQFAVKAAKFPAADLIPPGYNPPPGVPAASTIPMMGLHWSDAASPELNGSAFKSTFILGSYDGRFIFYEPMITKAYLESKPSSDVTVPQATKVATAGYYPTHYTINFDATAKEYRIVLAGLVHRQ